MNKMAERDAERAPTKKWCSNSVLSKRKNSCTGRRRQRYRVNQDLGDKFRIADDTPRTSSVASRDSVLLTALPPLQVAE